MNSNCMTSALTSEQGKRTLDNGENDAEVSSKKLCTGDNNVTAPAKMPRRRKVAILLGYNGHDYYGMQINKGFRTIELELFQALHKMGAINENEVLQPFLIKFQRAARTDKSVSAAKQVVSLMLADDARKVEDINAHLSPNIRVFSIKRVTKCFDSKGNCDARTYSYLLPTQVLSEDSIGNFMDVDYRISPERIQKINEILSLYVGTHNFHNFTSKRDFADPSAKRYIMSFNCSEPFVYCGKEFIILNVKGQSFMLHQIRKMVGTAIAIARGLATPDIIQTAFRGNKIRTPQAPGEGLFLEQPHFDKYDKRYGNDGIHEKLTWEDVDEEVKKFREEKIINPMLENELVNQIILNWVQDYLHNNVRLFQQETSNADVKDTQTSKTNEEVSEANAKEETETETKTCEAEKM